MNKIRRNIIKQYKSIISQNAQRKKRVDGKKIRPQRYKRNPKENRSKKNRKEKKELGILMNDRASTNCFSSNTDVH